MIRMLKHEAFHAGYKHDERYVEVFINPEPSELRSINSFPEARFFIDDKGNMYAFDVESLHDTARASIDASLMIRGSFSFAVKEAHLYGYATDSDVRDFKNSPWVVQNMSTFTVRTD